MILIDSNVIIDVIENDDRWLNWSLAQIEQATRIGRVVASSVVVAEVAPSFPSFQMFMEAMDTLLIEPEPLTAEGAFLGGMAFRRYLKQRDIARSKSLIADFLIGGHAVSLGASLLTRDARFYRSYFPDLTLITPETHPHG